ncbi:ThiF family adenylyltransferase [Parapedobacter soli]|uniref:ThiF family adenylyltransferase n=1 Tax=Parapedobacter soli TaxID=416955 RepID=UPI0021C6E4D7|nr:ThiF family adenylyltransferase [Parapedobacter soli]
METSYRPELLQLRDASQLERYNQLIDERSVSVYDVIDSQLRELFIVRNPGSGFEAGAYDQFVKQCLDGQRMRGYGVWVFYPWSRRLVHVLPEEAFIEVRTNRNKLKITEQEQLALAGKTVGVVGLSVGQSIALTLAMERTCGTLRLADFDDVELSNLNRIRTGVHNLNTNKAVLAAREIAEIDPFIQVEVFTDGLTEHNIASFLGDGSVKLDLLIEVCDSMAIKLQSRVAARSLRIPVVMETNDRCMLDIERFDLEAGLPILHGLVAEEDAVGGAALSREEQLTIVKKIVDMAQLSERMKQSFAELGKTLRSWPQLASSVVLGGGVVTDVARKILLGEHAQSGRYYFDIDRILNDN